MFARIAEAKIVAGIEAGEFDDLPGAGKPLDLEDLSRVPPHLRAGLKLLRNAGVLPPEAEARREIHSLGGLIDAATDPAEREELRRRRRDAQLRLALLMERRRN
jgi:thioredoxin-like negative regulator of GroEL